MRKQEQVAQGIVSRMMRLPEVIRYVGLSKPSIYRLIACGDFPPPVRLSFRAVAWPQDQVETWLRSRRPTTEHKIYARVSAIREG
jgi:prophage regulatory protein